MARRDSSAKPQARDPVTLGIFARRLGESMTARRLSALQVAEGAGVDERTVALWLAAEAMSTLADHKYGITGFQYGWAVAQLAHHWTHGEALRRWHNRATQIGTEGDKANETGGTLNPALLSIG